MHRTCGYAHNRYNLQVLPTTKQCWKQPMKHTLIWLFVCIYVCIKIYLKLLYIDIKSSSYIHEFYTSKYIHILLKTFFFRPPGPVHKFFAILWCLWWLCVPYLWYGYYVEVCDFYTCAMHIMHVYACSAHFDLTWTLYTTDFAWTLIHHG